MDAGHANVGLLHPGEMGSAVGAAARASGTAVLWASEGRSDSSRKRAARAGLQDAGTLASVVGRATMIVSVVPPGSARDVAESVAALGFRGAYLDANAVSPARAREIAAIVERGADAASMAASSEGRRGSRGPRACT